MEKQKAKNISNSPEKEPYISLEVTSNDVGNFDKLIEGYYVNQIKQLDKRKNRQKAIDLLENHLILPNSHKRKSQRYRLYQRETQY